MPGHLNTRIAALVAVVVLASAVVATDDGAAHQLVQAPPISLGTSGGNAQDGNNLFCCSGTLGALVTKDGQRYILSANHVLARNGYAGGGEEIIQPGLIDSSCSATGTDHVADFAEAPPLGTANVDAGIASVVPGMVDFQGTILDIGIPASTPATPSVGQGVAKSGRTTGLTCDAVTSVDTTVSVDYTTACGTGTTYSVSYTNQILIKGPKFSAAGDSGSLIVDSSTAQPVGLLFAGSTSITVANPIQDVLSALGVQVVGGEMHPIACPVNGKRTRPNGLGSPRAQQAKEKYARQIMLDPAVMAVGVGSDDETGEAVVAIFVEQGRAHRDIPAEFDGVRTKVYVSDRIRAYGWNEPQRNACHSSRKPGLAANDELKSGLLY